MSDSFVYCNISSYDSLVISCTRMATTQEGGRFVLNCINGFYRLFLEYNDCFSLTDAGEIERRMDMVTVDVIVAGDWCSVK